MSETQDPIAFREQLSFLRDSVMALAEEALEVFVEDFRQFFPREARRRFLASPEFARTLDDAALKALKADLVAAGENAAATLSERLRATDVWLAGTDVDEPADSKSLAENPQLGAVLSATAATLGEVLARHGFPPDSADGYDIVYTEPKRFVSRQYLPSIAEKYWRRIAELRDVERRVREIELDRERSELLARWNGA